MRTVSCDGGMFKKKKKNVSVTSTSWFAHVLCTRPRTLSGRAALLLFTLSRLFLTSAVETERSQPSGGGVDVTPDCLLRRSKTALKGVQLVWQHDSG